MRTLRDRLEIAIYGDADDSGLGVDPDRIAIEDGVEIILEAVVEWIRDPEVRGAMVADYTEATHELLAPKPKKGETISPMMKVQDGLARLAAAKEAP